MSARSSAHLRGSADTFAASGDRGELPSDVVTAASFDDGTVSAADGVLVSIAVALFAEFQYVGLRRAEWASPPR